MKIADAAVTLASSHTAVNYTEKKETLTVWKQGQPANQLSSEGGNSDELAAKAKAFALQQADALSLSPQAREMTSNRVQEVPGAEKISQDNEVIADLNMRILKAIFERLTGRKIVLPNQSDFEHPASAEPVPASKEAASAQPQLGWGVRYERHEVHHEEEAASFQAKGAVLTADGREIAIAVDLTMSRSFTSEVHESLLAGDALKDPLVISFDGQAAQLTQNTFAFDLDMDGQEEQIASLASGAGFLALDANSDGKVNDGRELFGAASGDGFAELRRYDEDGNSWIDENDAVFSRLRIWTKDPAGQDQLWSLQESGIGALYLNKVATPFSLKDSGNVLQGQVQASSIVLKENGGVGVMQQVDLVA